jgi:hypothetical protein
LGRFAQTDSIVPDGVQGYDRYAYVGNDPIGHSDPTGHVSCSGSNWDDGPQCKEKDDSKDQYDIDKHPRNFATRDLAHRLYERRRQGTTTRWAALNSAQQDVLTAGGFSEGSYNDYLEGGASQADLWHDPLTYVEMAVGGGGVIKTGLGFLASYTTTQILGSNPGSGITVLGYTEDLKSFEGVKVNMLQNVPNYHWESTNIPFLDQAMARGDTIVYISDFALQPERTFPLEVRYVMSYEYQNVIDMFRPR